MQIGIGAWRWSQHYGRRLKRLEDHYDEALESVKTAGATLFEPSLPEDANDRKRLGEALEKYGLAMPSTYRNVCLHELGAEARFEELLTAARWARTQGAELLTINAEPIAWGKPLDKTDAQLLLQAQALRVLSGALEAEGIQLAYHVHDAEFRQGAREFHAMMAYTQVGLCFDPQWLHRGCGNSEVAVLSVISLYGHRFRALHLRQTEGGIFTETFQQVGDIDYTDISAFIRAHCPNIPIYVEQGWEVGTPETLTRAESDRRSIAAACALFGG